jgi:hypothetical protein
VVYYIEAVGFDFETSRTSEWMPLVSDSDECRRRDPMLALFQGDAPKIVVGSVRAGAPLIPLGFQTAGIVSAGAGGGIGAVAIGSIVAGGAAGGVLVATAGGDAPEATTTIVAGTPSTTVSSAPTTSIPPATTTISGSGPGTTSSVGPTTTVAPPTTTIPGQTTTTSAGATTTTMTSSTTSTTSPSTTTTMPSTTTTTSAASTTTTSAPPGADVAVTLSAPATVRFGTLLIYNVRVSNNGPSPATGVRAMLSFPFSLTIQDSAFCTGAFGNFQCLFGSLAPGGSASVNIVMIVLQLGTVTANASVSANQTDPFLGNNNSSATTNVTLFLREAEEVPVSLISHLDVPPGDGRDRGEIVMGSQHFGIDSAAPIELHARGESGENAVEAVLSTASGRGGIWRFDFRGSRTLEAGTIVVEAGEAVSLDPRAVVFRVRGEAGERIRFRFRTRER